MKDDETETVRFYAQQIGSIQAYIGRPMFKTVISCASGFIFFQSSAEFFPLE